MKSESLANQHANAWLHQDTAFLCAVLYSRSCSLFGCTTLPRAAASDGSCHKQLHNNKKTTTPITKELACTPIKTGLILFWTVTAGAQDHFHKPGCLHYSSRRVRVLNRPANKHNHHWATFRLVSLVFTQSIFSSCMSTLFTTPSPPRMQADHWLTSFIALIRTFNSVYL